MAAEGKINLNSFRVLNAGVMANDDFAILHSTRLYPEWPLAKVKNTPDAVARLVVDALKQLQPTDAAAKNAKVVGWVDALDYAPVESLQETLKVGAFLAVK